MSCKLLFVLLSVYLLLESCLKESLVYGIDVNIDLDPDKSTSKPFNIAVDNLFPGFIDRIPNLTNLNLTLNSETLDVDIFSDIYLQTLTLTLTKCKSLPNEPLNISSLTKFTLIGFEVTAMPSSFLSGLDNVETLHLDLPKLQLLSLPSTNQWKNLQTLKIEHVKEIQPFPVLPALSTLDLIAISSLRDAQLFKDIHNLKALGMVGCNLSTIPVAWLSSWASLTELDLTDNTLTAAGMPSLAGLQSLRFLNLESNKIQRELPKLPSSLEMLILRQNNIQNLDNFFFSGLSNLKWLDLSNNSIHTVDGATFSALSFATSINLEQNQISSLPKKTQYMLCNMPSLKHFTVEDNPISCRCIQPCLLNIGAKSDVICTDTDAQTCEEHRESHRVMMDVNGTEEDHSDLVEDFLPPDSTFDINKGNQTDKPESSQIVVIPDVATHKPNIENTETDSKVQANMTGDMTTTNNSTHTKAEAVEMAGSLPPSLEQTSTGPRLSNLSPTGSSGQEPNSQSLPNSTLTSDIDFKSMGTPASTSVPVHTSDTTSTLASTSDLTSTPAPTSPKTSTPAPPSDLTSTPAPPSDLTSTPAPTSNLTSTPAPPSDLTSTPAPTSDLTLTPAPPSDLTSTPAPTSNLTSTPAPPSDLTLTPAPPSDLTSTPAPPSDLTSTPAPPSDLTSTPAPPSDLTSTPAPPSDLTSTPVPTSNVISTPVPTSNVISTPVPTSDLISTPVPTSNLISAPVPTSDLISTPVPTSDLISTPVPTSDLISTSVPTSNLISTSVPTSDLISTPVPTPNLISNPVPTPNITPTHAATPRFFESRNDSESFNKPESTSETVTTQTASFISEQDENSAYNLTNLPPVGTTVATDVTQVATPESEGQSMSTLNNSNTQELSTTVTTRTVSVPDLTSLSPHSSMLPVDTTLDTPVMLEAVNQTETNVPINFVEDTSTSLFPQDFDPLGSDYPPLEMGNLGTRMDQKVGKKKENEQTYSASIIASVVILCVLLVIITATMGIFMRNRSRGSYYTHNQSDHSGANYMAIPLTEKGAV